MIAVSVADLVTLISAVTAAVVAIIGALRGNQVHRELRTLNSKSIGALAGEDETRRIRDVPVEDRTPGEQRHLLDVPTTDK